jgi:hypothetical protein
VPSFDMRLLLNLIVNPHLSACQGDRDLSRNLSGVKKPESQQ